MEFRKGSFGGGEGDKNSGARQETDAVLKRLELRSAELDQQAIELIARRDELDKLKRQLNEWRRHIAEREEGLNHEKEELEELRQEVAQQTQALRDEHQQALAAIAQRMDGIRQREQDLERRIVLARDELHRQRAEAEEFKAEAQRQLDAAGAGYQRMAGERDAWASDKAGQVRELLSKNDVLQQRFAEVAARQADFDRQRAELDATAAQQKRLVENVSSREAACASREMGYAARDADLAAVAADLEKRIVRARDEAVRQREEVEKIRAAAQARFDETQTGYRQLESDRATWDQRVATLRSRAEELDGRAATLDQWQKQFDQERARIAAKERDLGRTRQELEGRRAELERERGELAGNWKELEGDRRKFDARVKELDARRGELEQSGKELAARRAKLESVERSQREASSRNSAEAKRLDTLESDLNQRRTTLEAEFNERRAVIETAQAKLVQYERSLDDRRADVDAQLDQIEARDAELRQRALALELQAEEISKQHAAAELGLEELSALRGEREREFEQVRTTLERRESRIAHAEASVLTAPKLWWLRATCISATAAALAVWGWLLWEPAVHKATVRIAVTTSTPYVERVLREHAAAIASPETVSTWLANSSLAQAWRAACEEQKVGATLSISPPVLEVTLRSGDPEIARRLAGDVVESYVEHVNSVGPIALLPSSYADLSARLAQANSDLLGYRTERGESASLLALSPPAERRDELLVKVRQLRDAHAQTVKSLNAERDTLAAAQTDGPVSGTVDEIEFARVLRADEAYQADLDEYRGASRQYKSELAVSMAPLGPKLQEMRDGVSAFDAVVVEQQGQEAATEVSAALEECRGAARGLLKSAEQFGSRWQEWRAAVDRTPVDDDVTEIMQRQTEIADGGDEFAREGIAWEMETERQILAVTHLTGLGTRELVIVSAVRSEFGKLKRNIEAAARAAKSAGRSDNFRLDAQDTRVRGLRASLAQRRDLIRDGLQRQADRLAGEERQSTIAKSRREVNRLELEREGLATELVESMDALRGLDKDVLERRQLEADLARDDREIARLEAQAGYLDAQLAEARRSGPQPDRVAIVENSLMQIAGVNRVRNTAIAGGSCFGGMWLLCALMILKNPLARKRQNAEAGLLDAGGVTVNVP